MAKVKITGHASGTGVVTVTAPNTSTDRTITLPDATATIATTTDVAARLPSITDNGNATAMTIDSNEGVGIKNTNSDSFLYKGLVVGDGGASDQGINIYSAAWGALTFADATSGTGRYEGSIAYNHAENRMAIATNHATAMNIDSSGTVSFGTRNGRVTSSTGGLSISSQSDNRSFIEMGSIHTGTSILVRMFNNNGSVGQISTNGSATAFTTSSDYRLKENVDYDWDATTRLKQLKPARFNFIADNTTTVDGFLAHEAQVVVPECVTGAKDAMMDEEYEVTPAVMDGDTVVTEAVMGTRSVPDMQGIDQSKLVPLLVKTIQELEARITALEA